VQQDSKGEPDTLREPAVALRSSLASSLPTQPRITIVTPSLNQGAYLGEAIDSVIRQSYPNVEHLIVESGSSDSTSDVLARYVDATHLRVIEDLPPRGQSHAVNSGLREATGEIIGWLNADDRYADGAFAAAVTALTAGEGDLVFGNWDVIDAHSHVVATHTAPAYDLDEQLNGVNRSIAQPTVFFRRSLLDRIGYLDESLDYVMDYDLWLRAAQETRFVRVDRVLAQFRHHGESKTVTEWPRFFREARQVARRNGGPFFSTALRRRFLSLQWLRNWRRRLLTD
jgi:glycosyltransferase involved in cell wall biosynthesis